MIRTYTLPHRESEKLLPLLSAYRDLLNSFIDEIWDTIEWKKVPQPEHPLVNTHSRVNRFRLFPKYLSNNSFKRMLRDKYLSDWEYAAHWLDSAEKTAFAVVQSWKRNYDKGERSRRCPRVTRLFARVKQSLCKLEGDRIRITIRPRDYLWIDISKRYFKLPSDFSPLGVGEPVITRDLIHLPIHRADKPPIDKPELIGWDSNFESMDGFSPQTGWVKVDTRPLSSVHFGSSAKLGSLRSRFGRSVKGRRLSRKYRHRERNRAKKHQIEIARVMKTASNRVVVEALRKRKMLRGRAFNYRLAITDWRGIVALAGERVEEVPPQWTTQNCSRCGWRNQDLKGAKVYACMQCGLRIDRQLNACIGIYQRADGVPYDVNWWDRNVLPSLVGGYFKSGAESKGTDELVRSLYETVMPQVEYGYDRFEDAYLPKSA